MNRFYITTALCLALAACSSDNDNALPVATVAPEPSMPPPPAVLQSSIVFDITTGAINIPNDLAFSLPTLSSDGTLVVADEPVSFDAPQAILASSLIAAGSLDGWSTQHPIRIDIQHEQDASLDPVSAAQAGTVRIFIGTLGGDITDPDCQTAALMQACKVGAELQYGIDFSSAAVAGQLQITPLKPLAGDQSYYVVVTNQLQNSAGASVRPSSNYEMLASDAPMNDPGLSTAQQLITSYEALLTSETDLDAADIIYSFSLTTQVTDDISQAIKARYISPYLQAVTNGSAPEEAMALLPQVSVQEAPFDTAFDLFGPLLVGEALFQQLSGLGLASCEALAQTLTMPDSPLFDTAAAVFSQAASFCAASVKLGSVNLPYYSSITTPLQGRWQAACSSRRATDAIGSTRITNLLNSGELNAGSNNEFCQSVSNGQLWDLDLASLDIADPRYITRFSPYPQPQGRNSDGTETIAVQFTVPDTAIVNLLATLPDSGVSPISKPESGWPIVVLQHGNTSRKEDFLIMAAALSVAGYATVAIDHPLHGERGITTQNRLVNATSGAGGLSSDYVNPESP